MPGLQVKFIVMNPKIPKKQRPAGMLLAAFSADQIRRIHFNPTRENEEKIANY
jgi:hypothetical protein